MATSKSTAKKVTKATKALSKALSGIGASTTKPLTTASSKAKTSTKKTTAKATSKKSVPITYVAPAYNENKYRKGISTKFYNNAIKSYTKQANAQRATQLNDAKKARDAALKQAYITRVQSGQALNSTLAEAGIRGGATETANLGIANQYGAAVGAANSDYANSVNSINQSINQNIADYTSDMKSRAEEYVQNVAQARWQAAREDSLNSYNSKNEYWNNYYLDKYSGYSKDALKKAQKTIEKKAKKAKTQGAKIRWQQALRGIGHRKGVIANTK